MASRDGADQQHRVVYDALSGIGGVAAVILGGLYLAGIVIKTTELEQADLPVASTLQHFPLEHILRTGLTLVLPALLTLAALGVVLAIFWGYERWLLQFAAKFREEEASAQPQKTRDQWTEKLKEAERKTHWPPIEAEVAHAWKVAKQAGDRERMKRLSPFRHALNAWSLLGIVLLGILLPGFCLLLPPEFAVPTGLLLFGTLFVFYKYPRPVQHELAIWYCIMLVALVGSALAFPRPLPNASVVTDNEDPLSGPLVLATDSTWYIGGPERVIRAVPNEHIQCAQIFTRHRRVRLIDHWLDPPATHEPKLECDQLPESTSKRARPRPRRKDSTP